MGDLAFYRSKFGGAVGGVDAHWVEQTSAPGEIYGYRLFQNDPRDFNDGFVQIRSYHMKDFKLAPLQDNDDTNGNVNKPYVGKVTLNSIEAYCLLHPNAANANFAELGLMRLVE